MDIKFRPLGLAREIVEGAGMQISWAYDDLVFVEGNPFILRFNDDDPKQIFLHFNTECITDAKHDLTKKLIKQGKLNDFQITVSNDYMLQEKTGKEELEIHFLN